MATQVLCYYYSANTKVNFCGNIQADKRLNNHLVYGLQLFPDFDTY